MFAPPNDDGSVVRPVSDADGGVDVNMPLRTAGVDHQERCQDQRGCRSRRFDPEAEVRLRRPERRGCLFEGKAVLATFNIPARQDATHID